MSKNAQDPQPKIALKQRTATKPTHPDVIDAEHSIPKCLVKCQDCGERQKIVWTAELICSVCGSKKFFPVVKVDSLTEEPPSTPDIKIEKEKKIRIRIKKKDIRKLAKIFLVLLLVVIWGKIGIMFIEMIYNRNHGQENLRWEYHCLTCKHRYTDIPQIAPIRCQICNSKTAYVTFICNDTGKRFTMTDRTKVPRSPYTNSTNIEIFHPRSQ